MTPYLTVLVTGRNDGWGVDFNERFFRTLSFNHRALSDRGVVYEVMFVEWAPLDDRPLLAELLARAVPEVASTVLTTYVVDREYHDALIQNPRLEYLEFIAKNVGLRRSSGRFVLMTNSDVYLSRGIVDAIGAQALEPATLHRARRIDVKLGSDQSHLDWDAMEDERNHLAHQTIGPPLYSGGTGDFILMDRESLFRLKGFNEVYRKARVGIDYNFLVKTYGSGYRIVDIGHPVFHVSHVGSLRVSKSLYRDRPDEAPWGDQRWPSHAVVYDNPDSWGLGDAPVVEIGPRMHRLRFDWRAVPPIVDLRRIVLPVSRVGRTLASPEPGPAIDKPQ